jgi:hypothetical protein
MRKTIIEAPVQVGPCFIVPHQETEEGFVATLESIGFSPAKTGRALARAGVAQCEEEWISAQ